MAFSKGLADRFNTVKNKADKDKTTSGAGKFSGGGSGGTSGSAPTSAVGGSSGSGGGSSGYTQYTGGNSTLDSQLKVYSDRYNQARASGDVDGMRAANNAANQLRNQYGYAAQYADQDIEAVKRQTGYGGGGTTAVGGGSVGPSYPGQYGSLEEWKEAMGYGQVSAAEQAAIDAYIKQTVNGLQSQKAGINQSADEAARQAYISYMQSQAALPQALAASGYSGGMADSQRLALETGLQNSQKDIMLNRDNALNDIQTAIINAQLEGSIQGAQAQSQLGRDAISAFQSYMQQQNAYANQDFWQKYGYDFQAAMDAYNKGFQSQESQKDREWQTGESQANREWQGQMTEREWQMKTEQEKRDYTWNLLLNGIMPGTDMLAAAGVSAEDARRYVETVQALNAANKKSSGGGSGGGSSGPQYYDPNGLFQTARDSGLGEMYIRMNAKNYGLTSGQVDAAVEDYRSWLQGQQTGTPGESQGFRDLGAQISTMTQRTPEHLVPAEALKLIQAYVNNGRVTEQEARVMAQRYGIAL